MKKMKFHKLTLKILLDPEGNEFGYYEISPTNDDDLEWPWMHGAALKNPPTAPLALKVDLEDDNAGEFADFIVGPIPLVTKRFRDVLDAVGVKNIDYYPVTIEGSDEFDAFPTYFAANIVGKIAAAAPTARSTKAFGGPGANLFDELVLDPNLSTDLPIFILAENLSTVIVSDKLKKKAEAMGVDTLRFIDL